MPEGFGFDVLDLGTDEEVADHLKMLLEKGHKIEITGVMNNGHLQAIVTPEVE